MHLRSKKKMHVKVFVYLIILLVIASSVAVMFITTLGGSPIVNPIVTPTVTLSGSQLPADQPAVIIPGSEVPTGDTVEEEMLSGDALSGDVVINLEEADTVGSGT